MVRFRVTLIVVSLVLLFLGYQDAGQTLRNPEPLSIELSTLLREGAPREWLHVTGGYQNLDAAISTSGQAERFTALLIPLVTDPDENLFQVLVETRDPGLLDLLYRYHFGFDNVFAQERFREEQSQAFRAPREVTGMVVTGTIAESNRSKLLELAQATGLNVAENVIFISEGKTPAQYRGFFFLAMGLAGLVKGILMFRAPGTKPQAPRHP
ncbi:hypothetical protein [Geoalkalibacter sp.]|uniref:hypothetical protein n=1 Tax=Geoalkalibacter sp. TaxID=3041440 RepID=UPI00272EC738|nr:hypothetical protein [Geoalkalibacter sp.]